jgi:hypothetical protein
MAIPLLRLVRCTLTGLASNFGLFAASEPASAMYCIERSMERSWYIYWERQKQIDPARICVPAVPHCRNPNHKHFEAFCIPNLFQKQHLSNDNDPK